MEGLHQAEASGSMSRKRLIYPCGIPNCKKLFLWFEQISEHIEKDHLSATFEKVQDDERFLQIAPGVWKDRGYSSTRSRPDLCAVNRLFDAIEAPASVPSEPENVTSNTTDISIQLPSLGSMPPPLSFSSIGSQGILPVALPTSVILPNPRDTSNDIDTSMFFRSPSLEDEAMDRFQGVSHSTPFDGTQFPASQTEPLPTQSQDLRPPYSPSSPFMPPTQALLHTQTSNTSNEAEDLDNQKGTLNNGQVSVTARPTSVPIPSNPGASVSYHSEEMVLPTRLDFQPELQSANIERPRGQSIPQVALAFGSALQTPGTSRDKLPNSMVSPQFSFGFGTAGGGSGAKEGPVGPNAHKGQIGTNNASRPGGVGFQWGGGK